jgi:hypothetical protein
MAVHWESDMFFAETLGPWRSHASSAALLRYLNEKAAGRATLSGAELHALVAEFLTRREPSLTPDAAIKLLQLIGRVAAAPGGNFRIAA